MGSAFKLAAYCGSGVLVLSLIFGPAGTAAAIAKGAGTGVGYGADLVADGAGLVANTLA